MLWRATKCAAEGTSTLPLPCTFRTLGWSYGDLSRPWSIWDSLTSQTLVTRHAHQVGWFEGWSLIYFEAKGKLRIQHLRHSALPIISSLQRNYRRGSPWFAHLHRISIHRTLSLAGPPNSERPPSRPAALPIHRSGTAVLEASKRSGIETSPSEFIYSQGSSLGPAFHPARVIELRKKKRTSNLSKNKNQ